MLKHQGGMSLIELLVAIAIGLVISTALGGLFITTTKAKQEVNRMGEQIENGRIAMDFLSENIRHAGYWDGLGYTDMADPALPVICATDVNDLKNAVPVFVQGIDNVSSGTTPSCISDVKLNTDIVVVRRAGTCVVGATGCESVAPYFQSSRCTPPATRQDGTTGSVASGAELGSTTAADWYGVATDPATLTLHKRDCNNTSLPGAPNLADIRRYIVRIYFVANNDRAGDGLPSLKMAELRGTTWTTTTIASGIDQLHLEYGVDSSGGTAPESYVTAPGTVADWRKITAVKLHVLSRNSSSSPDYTDNKTYVLGKKADGTDNTFGPFTDKIRRHSFSGLVGVTNPVGLRGG